MARLLSMIEFAYNNVKNTSISYTTFELKFDFYYFANYKKTLNFALNQKPQIN